MAEEKKVESTELTEAEIKTNWFESIDSFD